MAHLMLALLGPLQITLDGRLVTGFGYDKVRALLAYLTVEADRPHRRDALAELLWPDQPNQVARNSLRQALATLRQAIGDQVAAVPFLHITREAVQFNRASDHDLDVAKFTALLAACERHPHRHPETCTSCTRRLQEAVVLYRGEFLAQFYLPDNVPFEEWALVKREQLHWLILQALIQLADYHERRGDYAQTHRYVCRQLELDPWREETHRQLMRLLMGRGQRSAALAQYERCRRILAEELGVEPAAETTALYERIRDAEGDTSTASELLAHPSVRLHNLPAPTTPFVGREHELAELTDLIANPACRLLTLVGLGGVGKTRLALRAALEQIGAFTHGVYFVSLASLSSAVFLVPAIAGALRFTFAGQEDPKEQLLRYLCEKELLLVLDNLEHLLAGAGLLTDILQHAPGVSILATSRERLNLQGEWVVEVAGLQVPEADQIADIEEYSAVALFLQSARRVQTDFVLSAAETPAVARICRLVTGMPLGIELAAAWLRVLSCTQIAQEITQSMGFLITALRDMPARHRSLWAVFEQSWRLLTDAEQCVFRKLSVFRGGFGREASEQVAGASLPLLSGLVDKSLLHRNPAGRYELHELVRQYAGEKLQEAGEEGVTRQRHAEYYLRLAEATEPTLKGPEQAISLARLETECDNLRAVIEWALSADVADMAVRLAAALSPFWDVCGYWSEGRRWFDSIVGKMNGVVAAANMATLYQRAGLLAWNQGDYEQARRLSEQSLVLYREQDDRSGIAEALNTLAWVERNQGHYGKAVALFEESLSLCYSLNSTLASAAALHDLGWAVQSQGEDERARLLFEESLALHQKIGNTRGSARSLNGMGDVARCQGNYVDAARLYTESLALHRELGSKSGIALALHNLAWAAQYQGDPQLAEESFLESLALSREIANKEGIALCIAGLASVAKTRGQFVPAVRLMGAAEVLRESIGMVLDSAERMEYARTIDSTRAMLGEHAFAAAWAAGRAMTLEQAIADALDGGA